MPRFGAHSVLQPKFVLTVPLGSVQTRFLLVQFEKIRFDTVALVISPVPVKAGSRHFQARSRHRILPVLQCRDTIVFCLSLIALWHVLGVVWRHLYLIFDIHNKLFVLKRTWYLKYPLLAFWLGQIRR